MPAITARAAKAAPAQAEPADRDQIILSGTKKMIDKKNVAKKKKSPTDRQPISFYFAFAPIPRAPWGVLACASLIWKKAGATQSEVLGSGGRAETLSAGTASGEDGPKCTGVNLR